MKKYFTKDDIGKKVMLLFNPLKVDENCYTNTYKNIPYAAIEAVKYIENNVNTNTVTKIRSIGTIQTRTNKINLAKLLGVDLITTIGDIVEVNNDYLKIK